MLNIDVEKEENRLTIILVGRLDTMTAPNFERILEKSLDGISELFLEMSELEYISSAGLRILLYTQKLMSGKGTMKLRGVTAPVQEIFDVTGFSDILTIEN